MPMLPLRGFHKGFHAASGIAFLRAYVGAHVYAGVSNKYICAPAPARYEHYTATEAQKQAYTHLSMPRRINSPA